MRPNRPHIPSSNNSFKEQEDKTFRGASLLAFPEPPCLQIFSATSAAPNPHVPPLSAPFVSVSRYLRISARTRKRKKRLPSHYFRERRFTYKILGLRQDKPQFEGGSVRICRGPHSNPSLACLACRPGALPFLLMPEPDDGGRSSTAASPSAPAESRHRPVALAW